MSDVVSQSIGQNLPKRSASLHMPAYKKVRFMNSDLSFDLALIRVVLHQKPYSIRARDLKAQKWNKALKEFNEFVEAKRCQPVTSLIIKMRLSRLMDRYRENSLPKSVANTGLSEEEFHEFETLSTILYNEVAATQKQVTKGGSVPVKRKPGRPKTKYEVQVVKPTETNTFQYESNDTLDLQLGKDNLVSDDQNSADDFDYNSEEDSIGQEQRSVGSEEEEEEVVEGEDGDEDDHAIPNGGSRHARHKRNGNALVDNSDGDTLLPQFLSGLQDVLIKVEKQRVPNIVNNIPDGRAKKSVADISRKCDHLQRDVDHLKLSLSDINVKLNKIMDLLNA